MTLLTVQSLSGEELSGDGVIDFSYSALNASTTKIVIIYTSFVLDAATANDPSLASTTWDQGGTDESPTFITGSGATVSFASDRHVHSEAWYLDSPTATAGTLRITANFTASTAHRVIVHIFEFDSEADTGFAGDVQTYTSNNGDPSLTLTTRNNDSIVILAGGHQLADANPFTPTDSTVEDYDADAANICGFAGHKDATSTSTTVGYTQTTGRRVAVSSVEVEQTPAAGGTEVVDVVAGGIIPFSR